MPVLDPVSPFLALIDRLIDLIRERKTRRRDYFDKIIEPLYSQFTPLGEDYLKFFRAAATEVLDRPRPSKAPSRAAIARIAAKRDEFAASRARMRTLLQTWEKTTKKPKDQDLEAFLRAMLRFFAPKVHTALTGTAASRLVDFLTLWADGHARRPYFSSESAGSIMSAEAGTAGSVMAEMEKWISGEDKWVSGEPKNANAGQYLFFQQYVTQVTARLESSWYEIAGRYMDLKLRYLGD